MDDIRLDKKCANCGNNILLIESLRGDGSNGKGSYLIEICTACGGHEVVEVARLAEDQSGLNEA